MISLIFPITKIIKVPLQQALLICGTCFFYCFLVYSCSGGTPAFPVTSAILPDYSQNRSSSVLSSALHIAMHRFIDGL